MALRIGQEYALRYDSRLLGDPVNASRFWQVADENAIQILPEPTQYDGEGQYDVFGWKLVSIEDALYLQPVVAQAVVSFHSLFGISLESVNAVTATLTEQTTARIRGLVGYPMAFRLSIHQRVFDPGEARNIDVDSSVVMSVWAAELNANGIRLSFIDGTSIAPSHYSLWGNFPPPANFPSLSEAILDATKLDAGAADPHYLFAYLANRFGYVYMTPTRGNTGGAPDSFDGTPFLCAINSPGRADSTIFRDPNQIENFVQPDILISAAGSMLERSNMATTGQIELLESTDTTMPVPSPFVYDRAVYGTLLSRSVASAVRTFSGETIAAPAEELSFAIRREGDADTIANIQLRLYSDAFAGMFEIEGRQYFPATLSTDREGVVLGLAR